jgi:hypothetical protein
MFLKVSFTRSIWIEMMMCSCGVVGIWKFERWVGGGESMIKLGTAADDGALSRLVVDRLE